MKFKSESDKWLAVNALALAANKYEENVAVLRKESDRFPSNAWTYAMLIEQFERQAKEVRRITSQIEEEG
jgi:hypothetical protein